MSINNKDDAMNSLGFQAANHGKLVKFILPKLFLLFVLSITFLSFLVPDTYSQTLSESKVVIKGVQYSPYVLRLVLMQNFRAHHKVRPWLKMVERNLCWSGNFAMVNSTNRLCPAKGKVQEFQMELDLVKSSGRKEFSITLTDNAGVALFQRKKKLRAGKLVEDDVLDLVNEFSKRLTRQPGILGTTLAFSFKQPKRSKVIARADTHGRNIASVSKNKSISILPDWHPDGKGIIYTTVGRTGTQVIYDLLNGRTHTLANFKGVNSGGTWTEDGKGLILTLSMGGNADLYELNASTLKRKRITNHRGIDTSPSISPDGNYLLFVSDRAGTEQIYMLYRPSKEIFRLTFTGLRNTDPVWSPDGSMIAFTKTVARHDQIHVMDLFGENAKAITKGNYHSETPAWSPDGKQIAYASNRTGDYKLYIMFANGDGKRRLTNTGRGFSETSPTWTMRKF